MGISSTIESELAPRFTCGVTKATVRSHISKAVIAVADNFMALSQPSEGTKTDSEGKGLSVCSELGACGLRNLMAMIDWSWDLFTVPVHSVRYTLYHTVLLRKNIIHTVCTYVNEDEARTSVRAPSTRSCVDLRHPTDSAAGGNGEVRTVLL